MSEILLEEHGYFWWNDTPITSDHIMPESSIPGTLKIDTNGNISLDIHGILSSAERLGSTMGNHYQQSDLMIQGILRGSTRYILISKPRENGATFVSEGLSHQKFTAKDCLLSKNKFPSSKKIISFGFKLELTGLEDWIGLRSLNTKRSKRALNVTYRPPKGKKYKLSDGSLFIQHDLLGPTLGPSSTRRLSLTEKTYIELKLRRPASIDSIRDQYSNLESFFMIITGCRINLDWPTIKIGKERIPCEYYYNKPRSTPTTPKWHEICLTLGNTTDTLGSLFDSWRSKQEQFGPGFYLYLGAFRAANSYIENRYVNLIWGLESLHRRTPLEHKAEPKLQEKINRILEKHSGNDLRWLKSKLKNAGEPSLAERLFDTFSRLPLDLEETSLREFCKKSADRRNDISHFGGQRHDINYGEFITDLHIKSEAISNLYHAAILQEIGVNHDHIRWWYYDGTKSHELKRNLEQAGILFSRQDQAKT